MNKTPDREWSEWFRKHRELLGSLTAYDIGLGYKAPTLPKRWCISMQPKEVPLFLEETTIIPFWHGIEPKPRVRWYRKVLDFLTAWR